MHGKCVPCTSRWIVAQLVEQKVTSMKSANMAEYMRQRRIDRKAKALELLGLDYHNKYIFKRIPKRRKIYYILKIINRPVSISDNEDLNLTVSKDIF